jgi:hypothetical protein
MAVAHYFVERLTVHSDVWVIKFNLRPGHQPRVVVSLAAQRAGKLGLGPAALGLSNILNDHIPKRVRCRAREIKDTERVLLRRLRVKCSCSATASIFDRDHRCLGPDKESLGRGPNDYRRYHRIAVNWINIVDALFLIIFGEGLRGPRQLR